MSTPRQWKASLKDGRYYIDELIPSGNHRTPATQPVAILVPLNSKANAPLIEAAPELLAALEGMFEAHKSYSAEFNPSGKARAVADWGLINEKMMAGTAAIAKAKGLK